MAEKYISKVRISGENYVIRDKDSYALAQAAKTAAQTAQAAADAAQNTADHISVPVDGVTGDITFKDKNDKMYRLDLVGKKVKLVAVTYNAPSIKINDFTWNNSNATSYKIDKPSTGSVSGAVADELTI